MKRKKMNFMTFLNNTYLITIIIVFKIKLFYGLFFIHSNVILKEIIFRNIA